jgi:RNA polymerase sigma-70 factor (ECF subfamily)
VDGATLAADAPVSATRQEPEGTGIEETQRELRAIHAEHYDFIWRSLRRLGLDAAGADDAAQQVFVVASRKLAGIRVGGERAYLFGIALRVASDARRAAAGRREHPSEDVDQAPDPSPGADEILDQRRARALLDEALGHLPLPLRVVFTLHELEDMTMSEIADVVGIAPGTVASRLRKARQLFESAVARLGRAAKRGWPVPGGRSP